MTFDRRILACAALSVVAHVALARAMRGLPKRPDGGAMRRTIAIRVVSMPPAAEPPPEPVRAAPAPSSPHVASAERAHARRASPEPQEVVSKEVTHPAQTASPLSESPSGAPVFGVSMESTSQAGAGAIMPIGNPGHPREGDGGPGLRVKGDETRPVAAYEVTKMPLPQGRCAGVYTDEAKQAAVEGTVVLDLVVGVDGRVREVQVVSGLGYGLTEAAVAAAKACRFSPGKKGDEFVPVRIREFKIRFVLQNEE